MEPEIHYPATTEDAAILFRGVKDARKEDESVRVGVVESPYSPARVANRETLLISCQRMNRIVEVSKADLLAVAEGGAKYADIAGAVREAGLYFPHAPRADATMAEMIMDGMIFPTEGAFGGLRESILSVELLTPSAEIVRFGSRAIKDVGGYEIIGFLMGQGGRCGMITNVTLRLLAVPCCRAYIAGRGGGRALKTLAHNLRKEFRPVSIEIFEGEAADLVLGGWAETYPSGSSKLGHLFDAEGGALLVGELQGLEPAVEDQLQKLIDSSESEHAAFVLVDEVHLDLSRRHLLEEAVKRGGAVVEVCYDGPSGPELPAESIARRSLYPERLNVLVPVDGSVADPLDAIRSFPEVAQFVSGITGVGCREQVYIIEHMEKGMERTKIPEGDLLDLAEEYSDGKGERIEQLEQARLFEELNSKVLKAFDPDGIMLP